MMSDMLWLVETLSHRSAQVDTDQKKTFVPVLF